jgi:hypothetical protein
MYRRAFYPAKKKPVTLVIVLEKLPSQSMFGSTAFKPSGWRHSWRLKPCGDMNVPDPDGLKAVLP